MLTDAALNRILRSLGAERQRLEQEIQRLERLAEQETATRSSPPETTRQPSTRWRHTNRRGASNSASH